MKKIFFLALTVILASCGGKKATETQNISLSGAGATFPQPFYDVAFKDYQESTGIPVAYGGIGSGGGIRSLKDRIVDFGATDAFLSEKEMENMPAPIVHIPTCLGAVVMAYNLPGVEGLRLTGEIVADMYLGKITKWNDARLVAINPGLALPDQAVNPIYRSDGSGTTFVFSDYLTKVSSDFNEKVGRDKALKWPTGIAAKGNPGVAGTISQTAGSNGYVGSEYAFAQKLAVALLQNKSGNFVTPGTASISAAADGDLPGDTRTMITDSANPEAYPIACFTWIILYQEQAYANRSFEQGKATVELLDWLTSPKAQGITTEIHYSPLPKAAAQNAKNILKSVTYDGKAII